MVINGVGGKTIAEARNNISYNEYLIWAAYRQERGSLFTGRRIEQAVGSSTYTTALLHGCKVKPADFMPHEPQPDTTDADFRAELAKMTRG